MIKTDRCIYNVTVLTLKQLSIDFLEIKENKCLPSVKTIQIG